MATPVAWGASDEKRFNTPLVLQSAAMSLARQCVEAGVASETAKLVLEAGLREGSVEVDEAQALAGGDLDEADQSPNPVTKGIVALERGERSRARQLFGTTSCAAAWLGVAVCEKGEARKLALSRSFEMDPQLIEVDPQLIENMHDLLPKCAVSPDQKRKPPVDGPLLLRSNRHQVTDVS